MPVKLLTSGGGGVNLVPSSSIASDQTIYLPTSGTSGGTVLCTDSTGGTANGVLYLNSSKQVTSSSGLVFDSSGNLLVGTASSASNYALVTVKGSQKGIAIQDSNSSTYRAVYMGNSTGILYFYNGTNEASLSPAGAWTSASDAKLKKNIVDIKYGIETVMQSQPRSFERVDVDGEYIGFIAQEIQELIPEVVSGDPERQLCIDYGALVSVAFKAIQEQQAIIESLTQRIEALEYTKQGE